MTQRRIPTSAALCSTSSCAGCRTGRPKACIWVQAASISKRARRRGASGCRGTWSYHQSPCASVPTRWAVAGTAQRVLRPRRATLDASGLAVPHSGVYDDPVRPQLSPPVRPEFRGTDPPSYASRIDRLTAEHRASAAGRSKGQGSVMSTLLAAGGFVLTACIVLLALWGSGGSSRSVRQMLAELEAGSKKH